MSIYLVLRSYSLLGLLEFCSFHCLHMSHHPTALISSSTRLCRISFGTCSRRTTFLLFWRQALHHGFEEVREDLEEAYRRSASFIFGVQAKELTSFGVSGKDQVLLLKELVGVVLAIFNGRFKESGELVIRFP